MLAAVQTSKGQNSRHSLETRSFSWVPPNQTESGLSRNSLSVGKLEDEDDDEEEELLTVVSMTGCDVVDMTASNDGIVEGIKS